MKKQRKKLGYEKCQKGNAISLYASGESSYSIGKRLGVKGDTVIRFLKDNGVKVRTHMESIIVSNKMGGKKGRLRPEGSRPLWSKRINNKGYIFIKTPRGWMQEHRFIMEVIIGRYLKDDEVVHHKDGNKQNNLPSNLELITHAEHTILHNTGRKLGASTRAKIARRAKSRLSDKANHPAFKAIGIDDLKKSLKETGEIKRAAILLGITSKTFYNKMDFFKLERCGNELKPRSNSRSDF